MADSRPCSWPSPGTWETSKGPSVCISKKEFQKYLDNQKKQGDHLKKLEKAYTDLATAHGNLSTSHDKLENAHTRMKKRENRRDKFITRMWKGVKWLWIVLNPQEQVPSTEPEDDDDVQFIGLRKKKRRMRLSPTASRALDAVFREHFPPFYSILFSCIGDISISLVGGGFWYNCRYGTLVFLFVFM